MEAVVIDNLARGAFLGCSESCVEMARRCARWRQARLIYFGRRFRLLFRIHRTRRELARWKSFSTPAPVPYLACRLLFFRRGLCGDYFDHPERLCSKVRWRHGQQQPIGLTRHLPFEDPGSREILIEAPTIRLWSSVYSPQSRSIELSSLGNIKNGGHDTTR